MQKVILRGGFGVFYDRPFGNTVISQAGNPPSSRNVTVRYGQLQTLGSGGLTTQGPPALNTIQLEAPLPTSLQWSSGVQMVLPWSTSFDAEWVGQHSYNQVRGRASVNINAIDLGDAFLPQNQNPTAVSTIPGGAALSTDLMRAYRGYGSISHRLFDGWRTFHSLQLTLNRRFKNGVQFQLNDTITLYDHASTGARLQHDANGQYSYRADQSEADKLLGAAIPQRHIFFKGQFVWDLPDLRSGGAALKTLGLVINDWQLSGVWTGATGQNYTVGYGYSSGGGNVNITGSPDFGGRVRIVGDPGKGCSSDEFRQFNPSAFQGPLYNSVGLESSNDYLRGCFSSILDLAIARNIRLGGARQIQLRVDMFNAPNQQGITQRASSITLSSPADPVTISNLPYDATGAIIPTRVRPANAGVGQATGWQQERRIQAQIRFQF